AEPAQGVLDRLDDPAPRGAAPVGVAVVADRHGELGGGNPVVAAAFERLADDLFGLAGGVDVGGVDEVDAGVERGVDDADRLVVVGLAPGAEHHGAEAQLADRDAGASQRTVVHGGSFGATRGFGLRRASMPNWRAGRAPPGSGC